MWSCSGRADIRRLRLPSVRTLNSGCTLQLVFQRAHLLVLRVRLIIILIVNSSKRRSLVSDVDETSSVGSHDTDIIGDYDDCKVVPPIINELSILRTVSSSQSFRAEQKETVPLSQTLGNFCCKILIVV